MDNNCTTDKFKDKNCMGLWEPDKKCKDTDCKYHKNFNEKNNKKLRCGSLPPANNRINKQ